MFAEVLVFSKYDAKVLNQATLYGIPMAGITLAQSPTITTSKAMAAEALQRTNRTLSNTLTVEQQWYEFSWLTETETPEGTIYSYLGQTEQGDQAPIQPRYNTPILAPGVSMPHGVALREAKGTEIKNFSPVIDEAVWDMRYTEDTAVRITLSFTASAWYPNHFLNLNSAGRDHSLVIGLGQFHGESRTQRLYGNMEVALYFSESDDWQQPLLWEIQTQSVSTQTTAISVEARDASGIHQVIVAYEDGVGGWFSEALAVDGAVWRGQFKAHADTAFFVQVVDGAGNVTVYPEDGDYLQAGEGYRIKQVYLPVVLR